jgi:hypothetical protein
MTTKQRILTAAIATGIEVNLILFGPAVAKAEAFPLRAGPFPMSPSDPSPPSPPSDTGSSMSSIEIPSAPSAPSAPSIEIPSAPSAPSAPPAPSIDLPQIPSAPAPPSIEAPQIPSLNTGPSAPQNLPGPPRPNSGPPGGRPPRPPRPPFPPWWWWQLQDQNTYDDTDIQPTTCDLLPHDVKAPPPFQYQNQTVTPNWDDNLQQWGFWVGGQWHPLYAKGC